MQQKFNLGIYNTHIHAYVQTSGRQSLALLTTQQSINQSITIHLTRHWLLFILVSSSYFYFWLRVTTFQSTLNSVSYRVES